LTETEISDHVTQNEKAFLALLEHHLPEVHAYADNTRILGSASLSNQTQALSNPKPI